MSKVQLRLAMLVLGVLGVLLASAVLYMLGMSYFEGEHRGFWRSLEWAAETLSTTGYGADETWKSPVMVIFVVLLQFIGVFLVFLIFPVYLVPFLDERFEVRLPTEATNLKEHVVIYGFGPAVATLIDELEQAEVPVLVVEPDAKRARTVFEKGRSLVHGSHEDGVLNRICLESARTIIANGTDEENAAVILRARQMGFEGEALALVEEPYHRPPILLAGASAAFTPRHVLGAALAARASRRISPTVAGIQQLGSELLVHEVRITRESPMAGKTLGEAGLGERTGVSVIGQWVGGRMIAPPEAGMRLEPGGILILVGSSESLERFERLSVGARPLRYRGPFLIAGYGEVGRKVVQLLRDVGEEVVIIDREDVEGVDRVGNVLQPGVLEDAGLATAQAAILALDTDTATLFAAVIIKDLAPEVPVIARVNRAGNVEQIHAAGADFALSISQVSGQILAGRLLGEEAISVDPQLKLLKVSSAGLEGQAPADLKIRQRTGCSVVAIERDETLRLGLGGDFEFRAGDAVYICGSKDATRHYVKVFPQDRSA